MSALRECPFCGGDAEVKLSANGLRYFGGCFAPKCWVDGPVRDTEAEAIAAWNRRAPGQEETRLRAEVASLRATFGQQPATEGAEPIGCPLPGMCSAVKASAAGYTAGAEAMREAAAKAFRYILPEIAAAIRALPLPMPEEPK